MQKNKYFLFIGIILLVGGLAGGVWAQERPGTLGNSQHYTFEDYRVSNDFVRFGTNYDTAERKQNYRTNLKYNYDASYPAIKTTADLSPPIKK